MTRVTQSRQKAIFSPWFLNQSDVRKNVEIFIEKKENLHDCQSITYV